MLVEYQDKPALHLALVILPGAESLLAVFELSGRQGQLGQHALGPVSSTAIRSDALSLLGASAWCLEAKPRFPLAWADIESSQDLRLEVVDVAESSHEKHES